MVLHSCGFSSVDCWSRSWIKDLFGLAIQGGSPPVLSCGLRQLTPLSGQFPSPPLLLHRASFLTTWWWRGCWLLWQLASHRVNVPRYPCGHYRASGILLIKAWKSWYALPLILCCQKYITELIQIQWEKLHKVMWVPKAWFIEDRLWSLRTDGKDKQYDYTVVQGEPL